LKRRWFVLALPAAAIVVLLWLGLSLLQSGQRQAQPVSGTDARPESMQADQAAVEDTPGSTESHSAPEPVVSRLGVPVHLVKRPSLRRLQQPYAAAYSRLEPAARAGDAVAQYQLGSLLYECRDVPADALSLEREVDAVHQTHRRDGWDVANPTDEERSQRQRFAECAGVPGDVRSQYRDWLKRAADAGLMEAQLDLPLRLPPGEWCQFLSDCSPQQRAKHEAMQKEALEYLGRARDAGSAQVLWTFGAWYEQGEVLPQNNVEAYAHFLALDEINAAARESQRFDAMLDALRKRLRPIDLDRAEARARELLSNPNCCVLTP
jgi:hypothetical protein